MQWQRWSERIAALAVVLVFTFADLVLKPDLGANNRGNFASQADPWSYNAFNKGTPAR